MLLLAFADFTFAVVAVAVAALPALRYNSQSSRLLKPQLLECSNFRHSRLRAQTLGRTERSSRSQLSTDMHPTQLVSMARGKGKTIPIKLLSSAGTGFFYTTRKNVSKTPEKVSFIKYDPVVRRRVIFKEGKIK